MRSLLSLAFLVPLAGAQTIARLDGTTLAPAGVDATVTRLMAAAEVTGLGLTIFESGEVAYTKAYGFRDVEKKLPLTSGSVMGAASFTKVAFTHLVMQLADEGRIDLDKPISEYLGKPVGEIPQYADLAGDPRADSITARMLLSHTAGFANFRWLEDDRKLRIHFDPGTRYAYSGEGMQMLQLVVETAMQRPLADLMRERVFEPFGMTRTSMVTEARVADDLANGYDEYGRSLGPQQRGRADAAGSMQTTLADFTRFMQAVMKGTRLSDSSREQMLGPQIRIRSRRQFPTLNPETTDRNDAIRLSYGLGWGLYWTPHGKVYFKEGHDEGFRHYTAIFDELETGIVLMTNSSNGEGIFKELIETLLANPYTPIEWEGYTPYAELPPRKPLKQHTEVTVAPAVLDRYVGRYSVPGAEIAISREGSRLFLQENGTARVEMFAESDNWFFAKTSDDEITFDLDAQGGARALVLHTGGQEIRIGRIE